MSKTQLKKELAAMTAEQIAELVLELYAARPEAKEYLDFFIKPDIGSKLAKTKTLVSKEMRRTSRGRNRTRSTRIRRYIADIASLNPGAEAVCEIMTYATEEACATGSGQWLKETTQRGFARLLYDTVVKADNAGMLGVYLPRLQKAIAGMSTSALHARDFRHLMETTLDDAVESL